ncbi:MULTISPECIES: DNA repair ATPase [unclassified Streptomyces]|uniref:DNA repair ATPase n=1 Tax=unclassified Streptomyces TaxID=2593676 RepID=UPI000DD68A67|nr:MULTISPECIES: DNA repair ATPase [unclassified Streptomyces]QZZ29288.1 AAA family ATPase [Streptomyces sp. ST1015]
MSSQAYDGVDPGTYELLRDRLAAQAAELARHTEELNARRITEFGATGLTLTGTDALRTEHPVLPRDIVGIGDFLLFGYDAGYDTGADGDHRAGRQVADVLALYDRELTRVPADALPGLLDSPDFVREFTDLHRYYRQARLLRLRLTDDRLLAVFRTGEKADDIRVLRWALTPGGRPEFLDARGDRDLVRPERYDFRWTEVVREDHVQGRYARLPEGLRISTAEGVLTLAADGDYMGDAGETADRGDRQNRQDRRDQGDAGDTLHTEPVAEPLQSLADADIAHARVGPLVLVRVRPYREPVHRYLVVNTLTRAVVRLDGIGQACRRLPDDQGIVFPGGYCLASGAHKTFELDAGGLEFEREVRSPYGEDVLYAFAGDGRALLLSYNTIREEFATPLPCQGWGRWSDGELLVLRAGEEPGHVHAVRRWASPYVSDLHAQAGGGGGALGRVGNADLVRGIADCLSIARSVGETTATVEGHEALVAACAKAVDAHHWLADDELGGLGARLADVRATAEQVLAEFRTVRALTRQAADALDDAAGQLASVVRRLRGEAPRTAASWVTGLTELHHAQGHLLTLKELRYADLPRIEALSEEAGADLDRFGRRAVEFLARPDAFDAQQADVERLSADAGAITTVAEARPVADRIEALAEGLRTVTEVVAGLDIGDATVRTAVLERVADVLGGVNRARAVLDARRRTLRDSEGRAEFAAEFALLGQTVTGALAAADTPDACDAQLAGVLVRLETLESRFAEFDDFLAQLDDQRAELSDAFAARRQSLLDARARRAEHLAASAARILETIARRAATLPDADAVSTHFASDPMVAKIRRTADELRGLGDSVRAEELDGRLRAARQEATRALRDRTDLYADDGRTLRLGAHRFTVTTQPLDLTLVPQGDGLAFALTGTDYRAPVTDPALTAARPYWDRTLPSESPQVSRAEYLAARLLRDPGPTTLTTTDDLPALVRRVAQESYDEGYERGVHDHDATAILRAVLPVYDHVGTLRHEPAVRAAAHLAWTHGLGADARRTWTRRAVSLARVSQMFGTAPGLPDLLDELAAALGGSRPAADYLFEELTSGPEGFVLSEPARTLLDKFRSLVGSSAHDDFAALPVLSERRQLVGSWLSAYASSSGLELAEGELAEAVAAELCPELTRYSTDASPAVTVEGLLAAHPRVADGKLTLRLDEFLARTAEFEQHDVPAFRAYQQRRGELLAAERSRLRLSEHRARPMTTFVRNRLIDEVYLPLIGDSFARQLGTAGETKRTDTGGLLLLISPPGYGKTTLMEYVADRLGLMLVKISGPALGHHVTSLDPAEAPDATARQEVEKVNFALAAGNNTLLYLDDIQHISPEFLQKFIPLCDATRRMDGVWNGEPRTFDLRGKRFAVCMAGNPFTESGTEFRVPDMLANRADVWNLGDVLTGKEAAFAESFLENALTSNPVLAPLSGRDRADLTLFTRLAQNDPSATPDRLRHPYTTAEIDEIVSVVRHVLRARETVLAVNTAYIESAAQSTTTRTEPPFRLQGSYRTMNRITQRIRPAMNDSELDATIDDHFLAEAQTLTTGAEANLLKLAELRGTLSGDLAERWEAVKAAYVPPGGIDSMGKAIAALGLLAERITAVEEAIDRAAKTKRIP